MKNLKFKKRGTPPHSLAVLLTFSLIFCLTTTPVSADVTDNLSNAVVSVLKGIHTSIESMSESLSKMDDLSKAINSANNSLKDIASAERAAASNGSWYDVYFYLDSKNQDYDGRLVTLISEDKSKSATMNLSYNERLGKFYGTMTVNFKGENCSLYYDKYSNGYAFPCVQKVTIEGAAEEQRIKMVPDTIDSYTNWTKEQILSFLEINGSDIFVDEGFNQDKAVTNKTDLSQYSWAKLKMIGKTNLGSSLFTIGQQKDNWTLICTDGHLVLWNNVDGFEIATEDIISYVKLSGNYKDTFNSEIGFNCAAKSQFLEVNTNTCFDIRKEWLSSHYVNDDRYPLQNTITVMMSDKNWYERAQIVQKDGTIFLDCNSFHTSYGHGRAYYAIEIK